ncbi:MAG: thioesterase family protein [Candidatus Omnitrophica bacterium]|nr:thioesterase family protein [Candidatus Omnitrophota bacterium]
MKVRIYYHHTDCGKVVYYATYLQFLEEARTEFLKARGIDIRELIKHDRLFVVAHQEVDYRAPAGYGDILDISTKLARVRGVRLNLEHVVKREDGTVVVEAKTTLALIDRGFKPQPLPEELIQKLEG